MINFAARTAITSLEKPAYQVGVEEPMGRGWSTCAQLLLTNWDRRSITIMDCDTARHINPRRQYFPPRSDHYPLLQLTSACTATILPSTHQVHAKAYKLLARVTSVVMDSEAACQQLFDEYDPTRRGHIGMPELSKCVIM